VSGPGPQSSGAPLRILLVDDDEVDRMAVRRTLGKTGLELEVEEAASAREAASLLGESEFDCALVDYRLPDGDGGEVLRSARDGRTVPVVMLTGQGDEELAVQLMKAGASDYLVKGSLSPGRLANSVRHAVRIHRAERQAQEAQAELRQEVELVGILQRLGAELTAELDLHPVLAMTVERAMELTGASHGAFLPNPRQARKAEGLELSVDASEAFRQFPLAADHPMLLETFTGGEVVRLNGLARDTCWPEEAGEPPFDHLLAAPVISRTGAALGALVLGCTGRRGFSSRQERLASGIAGWAAVALENARLYHQAQQAARARDEVLAVVSHDLREPLQVVSMASSTLRLATEDSTMGPLHRQLTSIDRSARRMTRLIDDLLDAVRIEAGRLAVETHEEPALELLREARETLAPVARERRVRLEMDAEDDLPMVRADRERVLQVFSNLVSNAVRFSPEGSVITLAGRRCGPDQMEMAVIDQGRGIPADQLPHLFDRFWQGRRGQGSGAGLGLAIVQGIVEAHGGTVRVESREGEGTTFLFTLPVVHASTDPAPR
jgi:signal transduction histidine kinase/CheY-like chemotaxis protein